MPDMTAPPRDTGFYPLVVSAIRPTTRDAVELTLTPPEGVDFAFVQGQYLTFRQKIDGVEIRRSYSICAGCDDGVLQVGIKRVDGGAFSTWANTSLRPGAVLDAMRPMGQFHTPLAPETARQYLGFAGGSGITPVLSILRSVMSREPKSRFTLVYANQRPQSIMFREEIEDLKNRHMGRLQIIHMLESDAADIELFHGRLDREKCAALFGRLIDVASVDAAYICGPEPMMLTIRAALEAQGMARKDIMVELFAAAQPGRLARPAHVAAGAGAAGIAASVILGGERRSFVMQPDQSVLEAALAQEIDVPFACKAGVCSTCKCRVLSGEVEMAANHALEDYEVEAGFALGCQSFVLGDQIEVDFDQH